MADQREEVPFKDAQEEYQYNLIRAEYHIGRALTLAEQAGAPKRSLVCKMLLHRARGIITGLYRQETQYRKPT